MNTPEQIATEVIERNFEDQGAPEDYSARDNLDYLLQHGEVAADDLHTLIAEAIEADRAQRGIIAQIAGVLDDRGARAAAQLVRDTDPDDDLWNNYVGPMIDSIEDDYTGMAKEINA